MDDNLIGDLPRSLTSIPTRRDLLRGLASAGLGLGAARLIGGVAAKKKRRKKKTGEPNAFGCINVGDRCRHAEQCCSGLCQGKKGKKRCRAHDTGSCPTLSELPPDSCQANNLPCTTATGAPGSCAKTTGNAPYCAGGGDCRPCTKDADCQTLCGPRAACIQCPTAACFIGTACMGPDEVVCPL